MSNVSFATSITSNKDVDPHVGKKYYIRTKWAIESPFLESKSNVFFNKTSK
jgi:hypothetical protein